MNITQIMSWARRCAAAIGERSAADVAAVDADDDSHSLLL